MTEFIKGQWYIIGNDYYEYDEVRQTGLGDNLHWFRKAGELNGTPFGDPIAFPASLIPDFSDAKVGDECFSPIHGIGYFTMMKHKWGETTVVYDNGVMDYAVCAKSTTTHPLRYNSFAQFQAYWAEQALLMEPKG